MIKTPIDATLASSLQSLAECQLQIQTSRASALDAGVVGLMGVDAAIAASIVGVHGVTDLWIIALVLICASFAGVSTALLIQVQTESGHLSLKSSRDEMPVPITSSCVASLMISLLLYSPTGVRLTGRSRRLANALVLTLIAVLVELASQIH